METYHWFGICLVIAACYADETFEIVPTFKKSSFFNPTFKFVPKFETGDEKFELVSELAPRQQIRKPSVVEEVFAPPFAAFEPPVTYAPPVVTYAPPRAPPPPPPPKPVYAPPKPVYAPPKPVYAPPKPVYGEPPVIKVAGSSSSTIQPTFDYTMIKDLISGMKGIKSATSSLKPGSYEYMSADGVPVSVKIYENFK